MRELGMSRTPIREAIIRLAKDGLVTVVPRRQTLVSEIRIGHLAEISEVRSELEGFAAGLAAERFSPADAPELARAARGARPGRAARRSRDAHRARPARFTTSSTAPAGTRSSARTGRATTTFRFASGSSCSTASPGSTRPSASTGSSCGRSRPETPPRRARSRAGTSPRSSGRSGRCSDARPPGVEERERAGRRPRPPERGPGPGSPRGQPLRAEPLGVVVGPAAREGGRRLGMELQAEVGAEAERARAVAEGRDQRGPVGDGEALRC